MHIFLKHTTFNPEKIKERNVSTRESPKSQCKELKNKWENEKGIRGRMNLYGILKLNKRWTPMKISAR